MLPAQLHRIVILSTAVAAASSLSYVLWPWATAKDHQVVMEVQHVFADQCVEDFYE